MATYDCIMGDNLTWFEYGDKNTWERSSFSKDLGSLNTLTTVVKREVLYTHSHSQYFRVGICEGLEYSLEVSGKELCRR